MHPKGGTGVGRFSVAIEIANNDDLVQERLGLIAADRVRRQTIQGVVDSGAAKLVLPQKVVKDLGLEQASKVRVRYADGRRGTRPTAKGATVKLLGREGTFTAIVEPKRDTALIGAIVLEDLDLLIDLTNQRLIPRDPRIQVFEIE
jgi:clan AA aspartic protease